MAKKRTVVIQLVGGLGNQLFGYYAGKYVSSLLEVPLEIDISQIDKGITAHGSKLTSFELIEKVIDLSEKRKPLLKTAVEVLNGLGLDISKFQKFGKLHISKPIGEDPEISSVKPGMEMRGYYQTFEYFKFLQTKKLVQELRLANPSSWYAGLSTRATLERPIMVHIRRGDYSKPENIDFGILDREYFISAIDLASNTLRETHPIWIFSDDEAIEVEFAGVDKYEFEFIKPPLGSDPAESLLLMSEGAANVISNSTFGWWSAIFGPERPVIAPSKWFKNMEDPSNLMPSEWLRIESSWK